jgi:hypothetical protein
MKQISDGQVEVALQAYRAVAVWGGGEKRDLDPMRAALEAYERVRDVGAATITPEGMAAAIKAGRAAHSEETK